MHDQESSLLGEVQALIQSYLDENSNISQSSFAHNAGLNKSIVNRIMKGITQKPDKDTVQKICNQIRKNNNVKSVIASFTKFPEVQKSLLDSKKLDDIKEDQNYMLDLDSVLGEWENFVVYTLSSNQNGIEKSKITDIIGNTSSVYIDRLLKLGIITKKDNRYYNKYTSSKISEMLLTKHMPKLMTLNTLGSDLVKGYTNYWMLEYVDKDTYGEILEIMRSALKKSIKLAQSAESKGNVCNIPLSLPMSIGTFEAPKRDEE